MDASTKDQKAPFHRYGRRFRRLTVLAVLLALVTALFAAPAFAAESVPLYGRDVPLDMKELDLTDAKIASADELITALSPFQSLRRVALGDGLSLPELHQLVTACPQIAFNARFSMNRQTYSTADVSVDFGKKPPRNAEELEMFLRVMGSLQRLDMFRYEITVEQMEALMARYPAVHFGWTVPISKSRSLPSNATAYSTRHDHRIKEKNRNTSEDFAVLSYCPDLLALDLGHNAIDDLSFLRQFPHLKVLILADNRITDISVLSELPELEYLELFMNDITDITPLASMENLRDLNLCYTDVADISVLYGLPGLERCWFSHAKVSGMDKARLKSRLRTTTFNFTAQLSTQDGWREGSHYQTIKTMFKGNTYLPFPD